LIGAMAERSFLPGAHREDADDRCEHADGAAASGKMTPSAGLAPIERNAATPRMIDATSVTS